MLVIPTPVSWPRLTVARQGVAIPRVHLLGVLDHRVGLRETGRVLGEHDLDRIQGGEMPENIGVRHAAEERFFGDADGRGRVSRQIEDSTW